MKKLLNLIICSTVILTLSSCNFFETEKSSEETTGVRTIVELPDSVKQKIVEQDAQMTELLNKVDTLTTELNAIKTENMEFKEKIAKLESPKSAWTYISIGAFVLGLIALIAAIVKSKGINENTVYDIVKKYLDSSHNIKERQTCLSQPNYRIFDDRLRQVENQVRNIDEVIKKNNETNQPTTQSNLYVTTSHKESEYQKTGYAKNDKDIYFTTIYDSNQEGCVFKISFTSPNKGNFNIISLDKIQSRNDWQQKIECRGNSIKEASGFRVEEEGICEKIDENTWKVIKPLKIFLL